MIPAGYLLKRVTPPPAWLSAGLSHVVDVCSVSDCVNDNVVDVQQNWKHNDFGLASTPEVLTSLARELGIDAFGSKLFYYEIFDEELESDGWTFDSAGWREITPVLSSSSCVSVQILIVGTLRVLVYDDV